MDECRYIDSHCHFDFAAFNADRGQHWRECRQRAIQALVIPGVEPQQWPKVAELCQTQPGWFGAIGLHPWWVEGYLMRDDGDWQANLENYRQALNTALAAARKNWGCVAVGEAGLDKLRGPPMAIQEAVLQCHLDTANEQQLPIIIHCVRAHNPLLRMLKQTHLPQGGVVHAFNGSYEIGMQYWRKGFYLGIGGTITYERAQKTRDAVARLPLEALLLESDAPDMPVAGAQGQRNSPQAIIEVARILAELRGQPVPEIARATTANARSLFNLPEQA